MTGTPDLHKIDHHPVANNDAVKSVTHDQNSFCFLARGYALLERAALAAGYNRHARRFWIK
jgi:hypothetical protein